MKLNAKESTYSAGMDPKMGKIMVNVPGGSAPAGNKQSAGSTKHGRMKSQKVENLKNMPNVDCSGGKGSMAGVA